MRQTKPMVRITAYIKPFQLEDVKTALGNLNLGGMTIGEARGRGDNPEQAVQLAGHEYLIAMPLRSRVELVVTEADQERVIQAISDAVRTEAAGSGKIFVEKVTDAIRIRTGESGTDAV